MHAYLSFYLWHNIEPGDLFFVGVSTNGVDYTGYSYSGYTDWENIQLSLDNYIHYNTVYIAFRFSSDASWQNDGVWLDYIHIWANEYWAEAFSLLGGE